MTDQQKLAESRAQLSEAIKKIKANQKKWVAYATEATPTRQGITVLLHIGVEKHGY